MTGEHAAHAKEGETKKEEDVRVDAEKKQELLRMSEISLMLDTYDDIFSDFDPRPYSERALSDDFLAESKKAATEKTSGVIDLKFMIPESSRNQDNETLIRKRLHEHFRKHHSEVVTEMRGIKRSSIMTIFSGFFLMIAAAYVRSLNRTELAYQLLLVMLEPSGWFAAWYGFDQLFYTMGEKRPELEFYEKMAKCEIHFISY